MIGVVGQNPHGDKWDSVVIWSLLPSRTKMANGEGFDIFGSERMSNPCVAGTGGFVASFISWRRFGDEVGFGI